MINQELSCICEGSTDVFVYLHKKVDKGPGTKTGMPFYNPTMKLNRDSSLLIAQWLIDMADQPVRLLDGLAASGIRGIRFAHELRGAFSVTINEWNEEAFSLIQKNISYNSLESVMAVKGNIHRLLADQRFDYIDIDPFGSPASFLDSAMRSIAHNGVLACTATDTAALSGVYPKVCLRRYGAWSLHGFLMREIGFRILLGMICREAAKYDKGIRPLWCFGTDHYFRLYVQILHGKRSVNDALRHYRIISSDELPLSELFSKTLVGPLWLGPLHTSSVLQICQSLNLSLHHETRNQLVKILDICAEESLLPPFFYSTDAAGSLYKISPPGLSSIMDQLMQMGYRVSRCSFSPYGFRTTAPKSCVENLLKRS
jgi:tRNA (guanine26-N2/guanine27-N2)-dimethyltransferase